MSLRWGYALLSTPTAAGSGNAVARLARRADLAGLREVCVSAEGPDDYVLDILPAMVRRREVYVVDDGGPVAMMGLTACPDGALWLGQMRTHARFQRRGYARLLIEAAADMATRDRRPGLRLWVSIRNVRSRRMAEATGFRLVGSFTRLTALPLPGRSGLRPEPGGREVWARWRRSVFVRTGGGYVSYRWQFTPLTDRFLRDLAMRRELLSGRGVGMVVPRGDGEGLRAALLAGGWEAFRAARRLAGERDRRGVDVFVPRTSRILAWARRAGFAHAPWGRHALLFERPVGRDAPSASPPPRAPVPQAKEARGG